MRACKRACRFAHHLITTPLPRTQSRLLLLSTPQPARPALRAPPPRALRRSWLCSRPAAAAAGAGHAAVGHAAAWGGAGSAGAAAGGRGGKRRQGPTQEEQLQALLGPSLEARREFTALWWVPVGPVCLWGCTCASTQPQRLLQLAALALPHPRTKQGGARAGAAAEQGGRACDSDAGAAGAHTQPARRSAAANTVGNSSQS